MDPSCDPDTESDIEHELPQVCLILLSSKLNEPETVCQLQY